MGRCDAKWDNASLLVLQWNDNEYGCSVLIHILSVLGCPTFIKVLQDILALLGAGKQ